MTEEQKLTRRERYRRRNQNRRKKYGHSNVVVKRRKKKKVFARDNFQCVVCGSPFQLTLDHIIPLKDGGKATMDNLQTLCKYHHLKKDFAHMFKDEVELSTSPTCAISNRMYINNQGVNPHLLLTNIIWTKTQCITSKLRTVLLGPLAKLIDKGNY